jgi:hypothetical protein
MNTAVQRKPRLSPMIFSTARVSSLIFNRVRRIDPIAIPTRKRRHHRHDALQVVRSDHWILLVRDFAEFSNSGDEEARRIEFKEKNPVLYLAVFHQGLEGHVRILFQRGPDRLGLRQEGLTITMSRGFRTCSADTHL